MKTNEVPNDNQDVCLIDLFAGETESQCRMYLSPLVYVPLHFQEELRLIHNNRGDTGLMRTVSRLLLPVESMDFVRRPESGIVDVHFRFSDVTVLDAKDCPFAN